MDFAHFYNQTIKSILERDLAPEDGLGPDKIEAREQELGSRLPLALREYYRVAGRRDDLNRSFHRLARLSELEVDDGYLIFMEEHQVVVLWGVKTTDCSHDDPEVWQGLNRTPMEWNSEEMTVSEFLHETLSYTFGLGEEEDDESA